MNNAGGVVTVTMAQVVDGVKNRVLTARVQFNDNNDVKYRYTGTDANPVFPAGGDTLLPHQLFHRQRRVRGLLCEILEGQR